MKTRKLLLASLAICLLSACGGIAPAPTTTIPPPTIVPTAAPQMKGALMVTLLPVLSAGLLAVGQRTLNVNKGRELVPPFQFREPI
jgi:hypothetical protein